MKTWSLCIAFVALTLVPPALAAEMSWEEQLREMDYYIYHLSGLNAMNALNLSRDQIHQLQALARKVAAAAEKPPQMRGELNPGFADVRETYRDLTDVLMQGKDVPPALKVRVGQARAKEAKMIRASLSERAGARGRMECTECHAAPGSGAVLESPASAEPASFLAKPTTSAGESKAGKAHFNGMLGAGGMRLVHQLASEVDTILSDAQKQIMEDFSCCLVPPAALSNPVRAGQAEVSEANLKTLRDIRSKPEAEWAAEGPARIERMKQRFLAARPGLTESNLRDIGQDLTDLFDRTRKMSDAEFEMNKESLCAELKKPKAMQRTGKKGNFMIAFFLLMPGTTQVYDALLKRPESR